jgi:hypothetical protein
MICGTLNRFLEVNLITEGILWLRKSKRYRGLSQQKGGRENRDSKGNGRKSEIGSEGNSKGI